MSKDISTDILKEISSKMDNLSRLVALVVVRDCKKEQEKIELLDSLGFRPIEIAKFLNKTDDNVNNQLKSIRKKKEKADKNMKTKAEGKNNGKEAV